VVLPYITVFIFLIFRIIVVYLKLLVFFDRRSQEEKMNGEFEAKNMTIQDLADAADIDYSNLNRIENGATEGGVCMIVTIAEALGIPASELLP
jgi:Helix-turn-helix